MKKILLAIMAVFVMVSCGGGEKAETKTPGTLMEEMTAVFNNAASELEKAESAEQVVVAIEALGDKGEAIAKKYAGIKEEFENMDEAEIQEKYAAEFEGMMTATMRFVEFGSKIDEYEFTPEQEERINAAIEKME